MGDSFEFIVVGAGPAGAATAARLAQAPTGPKVLLLEAGGKNDDINTKMVSDRFTTFMTAPGANWRYKTVPQTHLGGQEIDASRGKGLGGGSGVNFVSYTVGPSGDYDYWAKLVGDDAFNWKNAQRVYKKVETFDPEVSEYFRKYPGPVVEDHGVDGPIHVSRGSNPERGLECLYEAAEEFGCGVNMDLNSGNPIGVGPHANSANKSIRSTASAYLENAPANLEIKTDSFVTRLILEGTRVVGVETATSTYKASKEVIVCAGAINTPQILMLSGIGPKAHLAEHGIECVKDLPIGQNLQDHAFAMIQLLRRPGSTDRAKFYSDEVAVELEKQEWSKDPLVYAGQLASFFSALPIGYLRNEEAFSTPEFAALPSDVQEHLRGSTIPQWEFVAGLPPWPPMPGKTLKPDDAYFSFVALNMSTQSRGQVLLASAKPDEPPLIDLRLLTNEFDKKNMTMAIQQFLKYLNQPTIAKDTLDVLNGPPGTSDEEIWKYVATVAGTTWHHSCTVAMGACCDTQFKVYGIEGLRVADTSVTPFVLNCHVQAVAYMTGEMAAEALIKQYQL